MLICICISKSCHPTRKNSRIRRMKMGRAKNTSVVLLRVKDRGFMVAVIGVIPTTGLPSLADISHPPAFLFSTPLSQQRWPVSVSVLSNEISGKTSQRNHTDHWSSIEYIRNSYVRNFVMYVNKDQIPITLKYKNRKFININNIKILAPMIGFG